jgi:hypothetical protein
MGRSVIDLLKENIHDEIACNKRERQICEIANLLAIVTLMFMIEEQGKHSCSVFMSFNFDFLFLLFVFNALFLVILCLLLVARLKLLHVFSFSSCCQANISCLVDFIFGVMVFFWVIRLVSWYLVFL